MAVGDARGRVVEHDRGVDRGLARGAVGGEPGDPLEAQEVGRGVTAQAAVQPGRHGVGEAARRTRVDADLGRQFRVRHEGPHRLFGEPEALLERRHRRLHRGRVQVDQRRQRAGRIHVRIVRPRYDGLVTSPEQAVSLANLKLERDAIVLYDALARIEKEPRRADAFRH